MYHARYDREFADHADQFIVDDNTTVARLNACQIYYIDVGSVEIINIRDTVDGKTKLEETNLYEPTTDVEECVETRVNGLSKKPHGINNIIQDWINSLKDNVAYRRRTLLSLAAFWSYATLGWFVLQLGTALPDLQLLVNIDLDSASWMFTTRSFGYLFGSLICGILYDRFNRLVIICLCELGAAVCMGCLPFSGSYPLMLVILALSGLCYGGVDTGVNTIVPSIWGNKGGSYMQALYLSYTVGGIIVPFATRPFLAPRDHNTTSTRNSSYEPKMLVLSDDPNESTISGKNDSDIYLGKEESHVQYAFIMTSALMTLSAIPYIMMAFKGGFDLKWDSVNATIPTENNRPGSQGTTVVTEYNVKVFGKRKWFVLFCVFAVSCFFASADSLSDFVVTFCIDYLKWSIDSSVTLVSIYWAANCIGGLSGIVLVRILRTNKLLFISHLAWSLMFLASVFAGYYKMDIMVWIFVPLSGVFMELIIPTIISWTEEHVCEVTGLVSSVIMISTGTGLTANPPFIGYMMDNYSYMTFLYILFAESFLSFICCVIGFIGRYACQTVCKNQTYLNTRL